VKNALGSVGAGGAAAGPFLYAIPVVRASRYHAGRDAASLSATQMTDRRTAPARPAPPSLNLDNGYGYWGRLERGGPSAISSVGDTSSSGNAECLHAIMPAAVSPAGS
jgi:hypothetical protein